jgi:hypothetical protein
VALYSTVQGSYRPFKIWHESQLDSVCVGLLLVIFAADIQTDVWEDDETLRLFLTVVFFLSLAVLLASTARGWWKTRKMIRCGPCRPSRFSRMRPPVGRSVAFRNSNSVLVVGACSMSVVKHLGSSLIIGGVNGEGDSLASVPD